jgi:adenylyltransferase/sulfurtransferase
VLLRCYVLRAYAFWREEVAGLERLTSRRLIYTHRQSLNWQVGFLFWVENEAGAGTGAVAKQVPAREKTMGVPEIRVEELKQRLDAGENLFLLDVREELEYEISNIGGQLIPLPELSKHLHELDINSNIVTICKMGPRGVKAAQLLHDAGFSHVRNLTGGIHAWSDRVDRSVRKY